MSKTASVGTCHVCASPIPDRAYQNPYTVRACRPSCAHALMHSEHRDWFDHKPGGKTGPKTKQVADEQAN